jgi:hypothetical protein
LLKYNVHEAKRETTGSIESLVYNIDELNRCLPPEQNQFFVLGDKVFSHGGRSFQLGKEGYALFIATANLGNGEFSGTFESDKALYNRLPITIDFDFPMFQPTKYDDRFIDVMRDAFPCIKEAPRRDISGLILKANKEIGELSRDIGIEAVAAMDYIKYGLRTCQKSSDGLKGKVWPINCQDCDKKNSKNLCSMIKSPQQRTIDSLRKYSTALFYLQKLKNPEREVNPVDVVFEAFKIIGAYQFILNQGVLEQDYNKQNPIMINQVVEGMKEDFRKNEEYIITSLGEAQAGNKTTRFFKQGKQIGNYEYLNEEARKKVKLIEPFKDNTESGVGMSWVEDSADFFINLEKSKKKIKKED